MEIFKLIWFGSFMEMAVPGHRAVTLWANWGHGNNGKVRENGYSILYFISLTLRVLYFQCSY